MDPAQKRPWYKKKRYLIPIGIATLLSFSGGSSQTQAPQQVAPLTQGVQSATYLTGSTTSQVSTQAQSVKSIPAYTESSLSNNNYYTNTAGNEVHSPAYSNSIPVGASAQCRDGTYSFSQSRRGTCSRHGGVSRWL